MPHLDNHLPRLVPPFKITRFDPTDIGYEIGEGDTLDNFTPTDIGKSAPPLDIINPTNEELYNHLSNPPAPAGVPPKEVTLWALRVILSDDGVLPLIMGYIHSLPDGAEKTRLTQFIEYGNYVDRASPTLAGIAALLNKTDAEIDDVFVRAAGIKL
jgi:hypothetical protein